MNKKVILTILDGWGIAEDTSVSAVDQADTPTMEHLYKNYPHATLRTDGENVGLPDGQMGNSEVGHLNLGAGRIVYQDLLKINKAAENDELKNNQVLQEAFAFAKANKSRIHFMGLVSDGGVHSHIKHLKGLVTTALDEGLDQISIHAFTDGRDVDPKSGKAHIEEVLEHIKDTPVSLDSVIGRYYAMDRDNRWERIKKAYDLIVHGKGTRSDDILQSIQDSYDEDITDEFIKPIVIDHPQRNDNNLKEKDVVIFFNFRTDRGRQLTKALSQEDFPDQEMKKIDLHYVTMTRYDETFKDISVVFEKHNIKNTIGEVLAKEGKSQVRIAETEKYPHVTFFFSGGREEPFENEKRLLCDSPKVATYDLQPEMSLDCVTDKITKELEESTPDFVCLNYANPDMVGHTGSMEAAIAACEAVDEGLGKLYKAATALDYTMVVIADHGNCEKMKNPDGSINTAHTTNPVPIILVDNEINSVNSGILGDIAPTVLKLMGVPQPQEMTQKPLI